ncbi:hypothetical protein M501DRAFT_1020057 [Patellaria atrata CBS 101060]|uniref:Uncharacterized protein n=1 Tax=Patellaria atrata CBS 101060 TaxID=1346257 RepID=A0A9P4S340_9PEZI|nr:hypothetical protein M501DRAFT_1020057 [Patellaria atrata CBS 101060]
MAAAVPAPAPQAVSGCDCEPMICVQSWPDSCFCGNLNLVNCFNKCGGSQPFLQLCIDSSETTWSK